MPKSYNDKMKELTLKKQGLSNLLESTIFLYKYFSDDDEIADLVHSILAWYEDRGFVRIEDELKDESNVIDFEFFLNKKKLLKGD